MCEAFIRLATMRKKPAYNIHYVSSVCEEIGHIGGDQTSFNVHPDIGISCDVGHAADAVRDDAKVVGDVRLGQGAALSLGPIYHKGLAEHFLTTAKNAKIPVQPRAIPKGSTNNGWSLKLQHGGAAVVQIAIPLRYMHSPVEVADLTDIASVIDLTATAIAALPADFNLLPPQP